MSDVVADDEMGGEPPEIQAEPLSRALGERYLQYALSTITHRALPDARDGLKPVHRRILYAMRGLRLSHDGAFRKCAKIVGEVMGNYHPHGDGAIYDALARLAQGFNLRYPLVDGQGNFGNIDGDSPAAQRYTEARLTIAAETLMEGLAEDAVDFRDTYDGADREPEVLPAAFPNLLANGASGIAVGMATSVPPHNVGELCDAALHLIKAPNARLETLMEMVPGPDFPTGGVIVEPAETIREAYRTGRGSIRHRAAWQREDLGRGQWQIVVTEIPYQVQKSKLIEKIAELIFAKKLPILADVRDESAEDLRIVLEPRARSVDPATLMESLFRLSDLEVRISLNLNVLLDGRVPKVCSLPELLRAFLDHRREVLQRRARHRLAKIDHRLEVLEGYLVAFLNLDRVIELIRTEDQPKPVLMAEFELSDIQAEAILNMRLRSLRRLEEMELRRERDDLLVERAELEDLLASEAAQWGRITDELKKIRDEYGPPAAFRGLSAAEEIAARKAEMGERYPPAARRTGFAAAPASIEVPIEAMVEREPITVVCSAMGWIRAMKGHIAPDSELKFKDGDSGRFLIHAETTDRLIAFASNGRAYTLGCDRLPGGRGTGEPLRLMVDLPNEADLVALHIHRADGKMLVASTAGDGFVVAEQDMVAQTRAGRQVLNVKDGVTAAVCRPVTGDHVAVVGENRKMLVFPLAELPEMGRGKGVRLQRYRDGGLADAITLPLADGLSWQDSGGRTRTEGDLGPWLGKRASAGVTVPRGFPRSGRFP
ncbi:MAG: DNA topoisomerase IV subunit A [Pseudomonadota bacterium]